MTSLAEVLDAIAEIERRPGYEGPKITEEIESIRWIGDDFDEQQYDYDDGTTLTFPREWIDDVTVGAIWRAVKARRNPKNHLDDWMIDIEDGGDSFVVFVKDRLGHKIGVGQGALAFAAALAWLAAIGGDDR